MDIQELKKQIRSYVFANKLNEAITLLKDLFEDQEDADLLQEMLLLGARFNRNNNDYEKGILKKEDYDLAYNQLVSSILGFLEKLSVSDALNASRNPLQEFKTSFAYAYSQIKLSKYLLDAYEKGDFTTISILESECEIPRRKFVIDFLNELEDRGLLVRKRENKGTLWQLTEEGKNILTQLLG